MLTQQIQPVVSTRRHIINATVYANSIRWMGLVRGSAARFLPARRGLTADGQADRGRRRQSDGCVWRGWTRVHGEDRRRSDLQLRLHRATGDADRQRRSLRPVCRSRYRTRRFSGRRRRKLTSDSRAIYALGQLALWIPEGEQSGVRELKDLAGTAGPVHRHRPAGAGAVRSGDRGSAKGRGSMGRACSPSWSMEPASAWPSNSRPREARMPPSPPIRWCCTKKERS